MKCAVQSIDAKQHNVAYATGSMSLVFNDCARYFIHRLLAFADPSLLANITLCAAAMGIERSLLCTEHVHSETFGLANITFKGAVQWKGKKSKFPRGVARK